MWLILSAMPEESAAIVAAVENPTTTSSAGRDVTLGQIASQPVVVAFSRWGKVAAASTAAHLLTLHRPSAVLFSGIAGSLVDELATGDLVVAESLYHHDLDASPFFAPTEVPLLDRRALPTDLALRERLRRGLATLYGAHELTRAAAVDAAAIRGPRVWLGDIATGDQVIGSAAARERIRRLVPSALCVEMEGAAVAQVCLEFGIPFGCVRMISDRADESLAPAEVIRLARRSGELTVQLLRNVFAGPALFAKA
jgi:adenosylhomocysteine nucleosidase